LANLKENDSAINEMLQRWSDLKEQAVVSLGGRGGGGEGGLDLGLEQLQREIQRKLSECALITTLHIYYT
jgi:hypothetical protein